MFLLQAFLLTALVAQISFATVPKIIPFTGSSSGTGVGDVATGGSFAVRSYLVVVNKEPYVFDAEFTEADAARLGEMIKSMGISVTAIVVTHQHPDH